MARDTSVISPNLGLYLNRPTISIPPRGLLDGRNFRIRNGMLTNHNIGYSRFEELQLNGPVMLIANFPLRDAIEKLIFATPTDLYDYNYSTGAVAFLTPRYVTGTAAAAGTAVTGTGTLWLANAKVGDEITFGTAGVTNPAATWFEVLTVDTNIGITLTGTAGTVANGPYTIRKKLTGDITNNWEHVTFVDADPDNADIWYATNGVDFVIKWDGTATQVSLLSSLGFTAKHLTIFQNMLIYGNIIQGGETKPMDIINSDVGQPEDVSSGLSEQFRVNNTSDQIVLMMNLGDNLAIYGRNSVALTQFVGDPLVFVFRTAVSNRGLVGARLVANFGDYHEFLSEDGQYRFDGASTTSINEQVWHEVLPLRDPSRFSQSHTLFDLENKEVSWILPLTSDVAVDEVVGTRQSWMEHYAEKVGPNIPTPFSTREFPFFSCGSYQQQDAVIWDDLVGDWDSQDFRWEGGELFQEFRRMIGGGLDGRVYHLNNTPNADGVALDSFVRFGRRPLGDSKMRGLLSRVYPFASAGPDTPTTLNVKLHLTDHASGETVASNVYPFDLALPEGRHFVSTFRRARFVEIEFGTDGPDEVWELSGYNVDIKPGGVR